MARRLFPGVGIRATKPFQRRTELLIPASWLQEERGFSERGFIASRDVLMRVSPVSRIAGLLVLMFCSLTALWSQAGASAAERQLFQAANKERKTQGLLPLQWSPALATAARAHAKEMARHN